jgi:hypothetical protein
VLKHQEICVDANEVLSYLAVFGQFHNFSPIFLTDQLDETLFGVSRKEISLEVCYCYFVELLL